MLKKIVNNAGRKNVWCKEIIGSGATSNFVRGGGRNKSLIYQRFALKL